MGSVSVVSMPDELLQDDLNSNILDIKNTGKFSSFGS